MKVKVLVEFRDVNAFHTIHEVGDVCEFSESRCERLVSLGYVEPFVVETVESEEEQSEEEQSEDAEIATEVETQEEQETPEELEPVVRRRGRPAKTEE